MCDGGAPLRSEVVEAVDEADGRTAGMSAAPHLSSLTPVPGRALHEGPVVRTRPVAYSRSNGPSGAAGDLAMSTLPSGTITLFFSDIEGSTRLLQDLEDSYPAVLEAHNRLLREAIAGYGGQVVDARGDSFFAAFARATDAVAAAVQTQRAFAAHPWPERGSVRVRVGLHTGQPRLAGDRYIGLDVHRASRICDAGHGGQVLLSQTTVSLVEDSLPPGVGLRGLGEYYLRDLDRPEHLYQLVIEGLPSEFPPLRSLSPAEDVAEHEDGAPVFVGRQGELERLRQALDEALAGRGRLVLLAGEAGIGKTSTAEQLTREARARGAAVFWGRSYEGGGAPPYWPWAQVIRSYSARYPAPLLLSQLGMGAGEIGQIVPEVRDRFPDLPPPPQLEPEQARFHLFDAVTRFLKSAARDHPLVLVLDDLHWADKPSLLLLRFVGRELGNAPLLILGAYRDEEICRQHPLGQVLVDLRRERSYERLPLHGLSLDEVAELVALLTEQPLGESVRLLARVLHSETEGNPFFIHEILRNLMETGQFRDDRGRWPTDSAGIEQLGIPEGVREAIGRRLSRLSDGCNRVLGIAAVVGREFRLSVLERVAARQSPPLREAAVLEALDEAVAARLIIELPESFGRYRFTHTLIRETLCEELSTSRRLRLQSQIGEALESLYGEAADRHAGELAGHFIESAMLVAGHAARAVHYSRLAARQAGAAMAWEDAAGYLERAVLAQEIFNVNDTQARCDLLLELGQALLPAGESRRVVDEVAPEAFALAQGLEDPSRAALAARLALEGLRRYGDELTAAGSEFQLWAERADRYAAPGTVDRVSADLALANVRGMTRGWSDVQPLVERALGLARQLDNPRALFMAADRVIEWCGPPEFQPERRQLVEEFSSRPRVGVSFLTLGGLLFWCGSTFLAWGERDRAEAIWRQLDELAGRTRDPSLQLYPLRVRALRATLDGRLDEAAALRRQLIERGDELGSPVRARQFASLELSRPLIYLGRTHEALATRAELLQAIGTEPPWLQPRSALLLAHAGKEREAKALVRRMLGPEGYGERANNAIYPFWVEILETAVLLGDREAVATASRHLRSIDFMVSEGAACGSIARRLGAAAALLGDPDAAEAYYTQAVSVAQHVGFRPEVALTQLQWLELQLVAAGYPLDRARLRVDRGARVQAVSDSRLRALGSSQLAQARERLEFVLRELRAMSMAPALVRAERAQAALGAAASPA